MVSIILTSSYRYIEKLTATVQLVRLRANGYSTTYIVSLNFQAN